MTKFEEKKKLLLSSPFSPPLPKNKQGVCHIVALPFTLKNILRQKKNYYGNSNISPCKHVYNLQKKKSSNKKPKSFKILL